MLNLPRIVLAPVEYVPLLYRRFVLRLSLCVVLTAFNAAVIVACGPLLYRASSNHPLWLAGLTLLFSALVASLLRVWVVMFRSRFW
jgi:hypothetical protein